MARTIRENPENGNPRHHFPSSKARKVQRRRERHAAKRELRSWR